MSATSPATLMRYPFTLNRWAEPTRWVDTHEVAYKLVEMWSAGSDGSPESLVKAIEHTLNGILKGLSDA